MKAQKCKGTRDLCPDEMRKFRFIEGIFRDSCLKWGYEEVRSPTLEYLHLFTSTGTLTPGRLSRVYSFLDWDGWSGERVVLRPDGTIPLARLYIENMEGRAPAKLFYVTNVFSFEETGKEAREKWQFGAELLGANSTLADVELITLAFEALKKMGFDCLELKIGHAGLLKALLDSFGLSHEEQDKLDPVLGGDLNALKRLERDKPELCKALAPWLDLKGKSSGFPKNMKATFGRDLTGSQFKNLISITDVLEAMGCQYQIDISLGRGFEYYTGVVFQIFSDNELVGSGGRYDALIPLMGGKDIPASGFALYADHLMALAKTEAANRPPDLRILVEVGDGGPELIKRTFDAARRLREAGYIAQLRLGGQEPAEFRWKLEVRGKAPLFILTDRVNGRKLEVRTMDEVLKILGGTGENSPA